MAHLPGRDVGGCPAALAGSVGTRSNHFGLGRLDWSIASICSIVEWGISIGVIAATICLFGLVARMVPVLSKAQPMEGH